VDWPERLFGMFAKKFLIFGFNSMWLIKSFIWGKILFLFAYELGILSSCDGSRGDGCGTVFAVFFGDRVGFRLSLDRGP
jgi:hypothetical protein